MAVNKKRSKKKKVIITVSIVAVVVLAGVLLVPQLLMRNVSNMAAAATLTATAQKGAIESTVVGTGNLSAGDTTDIDVPVDIKIDDVLVDSGDQIKKGDVLATLDPIVLQSQIYSLQSTIESLDGQIQDVLSASESKYIKSSIAGRIKVLHVKADDNIASVMNKKGMLGVISIDGKMKVSFEYDGSDVSVGQSVDVKLSDGTKKDGTVSAVSGKNISVTLTDNGPKYNEQVTVLKDAKELGAGKLQINKPIQILGTSGVVSKLNVSLNDKVSSGGKILTLEEEPESSEYAELYSQRDEAYSALQKLMKYSQTNSIVSEIDGVISSINLSDGKTVTYSDSSSSGSSDADSSSSSGSSIPAGFGQKANAYTAQFVATTVQATQEEDSRQEISAIEASITAPAVGEAAQTTLTGENYTGTLKWTPADAKFKAGTAYAVSVTLNAADGYKFADDINPAISGAKIANIKANTDETSSTLSFDAQYSKLQEEQPTPSPSASGNPGNNKTGGIDTSRYTPSGSYSGSLSSLANASSADSSSDSSDATDSEYQTVGFSVSTSDNMTLEVSIDELDILSLEKGQKAKIELDALEGKNFEGEITKVSQEGSVSSSIATFTVKINLPKDDSMRIGMSATATITTASKENVIVIPMDALQERGDSSFVMIPSSDEKSPGEMRTVKTGISNGDMVEITEGLSEGEEIMYTVKTSDNQNMFMMPGGGMMRNAGGGEGPQMRVEGNGRTNSSGGGPNVQRFGQ